MVYYYKNPSLATCVFCITPIICLCVGLMLSYLILYLRYMPRLIPDIQNGPIMSNLVAIGDIIPEPLMMFVTTTHHGPCGDLDNLLFLANIKIGGILGITVLWNILKLSAYP